MSENQNENVSSVELTTCNDEKKQKKTVPLSSCGSTQNNDSITELNFTDVCPKTCYTSTETDSAVAAAQFNNSCLNSHTEYNKEDCSSRSNDNFFESQKSGSDRASDDKVARQAESSNTHNKDDSSDAQFLAKERQSKANNEVDTTEHENEADDDEVFTEHEDKFDDDDESISENEDEADFDESYSDLENGSDESLPQQSDEEDGALNSKKMESKSDEKTNLLGCKHYYRSCLIIAPCCKETFWCRHCHNDIKNKYETHLNFDGLHEIDRFKIEEIVCAVCKKQQPVSNQCIECHIIFAEYFCDICKFWDNDGFKKKIFHCTECGICRVGGRENYFHCAVCACCYPNSIKDTHTCLEKASHDACPICLENMFSSIYPVCILQCGHAIHDSCVRELTKEYQGVSSIRCPLCFQTLRDTTNLWKAMDEVIAENPISESLSRNVAIQCCDCHETSTATFHFCGLKCNKCGSYNTIQLGN